MTKPYPAISFNNNPHPYSSGEIRLKENTNGLLRQYFPGGRELLNFKPQEWEHAANSLNYWTPHEAYYETT